MRLWDFYLCYCEGGFRERAIGTAQLLLAKPHVPAAGRMSAVVWFRSDLRADDNGALAAACRARRSGHRAVPAHAGAVARATTGARASSCSCGGTCWRCAQRLAALGIPLWVHLVPDFAGAPAAVADVRARAGARPRCTPTRNTRSTRWRATVASPRALRAQGTAWRSLHDFTVLRARHRAHAAGRAVQGVQPVPPCLAGAGARRAGGLRRGAGGARGDRAARRCRTGSRPLRRWTPTGGRSARMPRARGWRTSWSMASRVTTRTGTCRRWTAPRGCRPIWRSARSRCAAASKPRWRTTTANGTAARAARRPG